jgi:phosphoglycerate dehydrogenase-like enzyme
LFSNKRVLEFRRVYAQEPSGRLPLADEPIGNLRKVIGIVGASRIGRRLIELLAPFDFDLLLYDPYVTRAEADALGVTLLAWTSWLPAPTSSPFTLPRSAQPAT